VAEHQLNDADVDAVGMQPAGAFVPEVVPAEIDPLELFTIPGGTLPRRSRFDAVTAAFVSVPAGERVLEVKAFRPRRRSAQRRSCSDSAPPFLALPLLSPLR
jgi:hypothetical protein